MASVVLMVAGFVAFTLAAFGVGSRINLVALGLALSILAELLPRLAEL